MRELEDFALFTTTPEGIITTWNKGVENVLGYTEQEWLGQHASIIFAEEDRAAGVVESEMRTAAESGRSVDVRWHVRKDGTRVYMTGVMRGLRDREGTLIGYSKVFLDDTPRKHLEDALTRSNQDLEQFAFIASHDLQEPLHTLSNLAELFRQRWGGQLEPKASEVLGYMVEAAQRMSRLTTDLLTYSQLAREEGGATSVHLDDDLETALSMLVTPIEQAGAVITHDTLPNVQLDRNQMVRLFQNLVGNAIKFRKHNEWPRVHIWAEEQGNEWIIRVQDNGIGFPPEKVEEIFKPFKRLHSTRDYPGSGIGLAACKRIVEGFGGRIGADSKPGEGATFWFTIPVDGHDQEPLKGQGSLR